MNKMEINILSRTENIMVCRATATAFLLTIDVTEAEMNEVKTIISEAITNSIVHGYNKQKDKEVKLTMIHENGELYIEIEDFGKGIEDIEIAKKAMFTTKVNDERSGLGFTIIDMFSDFYEVTSVLNQGTKIKCFKNLLHAEKAA